MMEMDSVHVVNKYFILKLNLFMSSFTLSLSGYVSL